MTNSKVIQKIKARNETRNIWWQSVQEQGNYLHHGYLLPFEMPDISLSQELPSFWIGTYGYLHIWVTTTNISIDIK